MADIDQDAQAPDGTTFTRRLEDQGDGSHAPGSVLYLDRGDGTYVQAAGTADGALVLPSPLEIARGNVTGMSSVNKFGHAPSGIQTTLTDIWFRADGVGAPGGTQKIWLAPTAARIHTIASDSGADDTGGTGANSVTVHYLPDWDTAEATETVTGDLNAGIAMNNAAVIIHRMIVTPQATSTTTNVGTITATAADDATITAGISPLEGQTEMGIYGIPSTQTAYLQRWRANLDKAQGAATSCDFEIRINPNPDVQTLSFIRKHDISLQSSGTTMFESFFNPPLVVPGPAIIKIQAAASADDIDGESAFDLVLVDN